MAHYLDNLLFRVLFFGENIMSHNTPVANRSLMNIAVVNESNYETKISDDFILIRAKSNCNITLPEGVIGKKIVIKSELTDSQYKYNIIPKPNNTIDMMPQYEFTLPLESISVIFVENNWNIV